MTFGANQTNPHGFYQCLDCLHIFSKEEKLKLHMKAHTGEKPFECSKCDFRCSQNNDLLRHERTKHSTDPKHRYTCKICSKSYTRQNTLNRHLVMHTGERPYKCAECDQSFRRSKGLRDHERTHSGEEPYCCTKCGKRFRTLDNYHNHARKNKPCVSSQKVPNENGFLSEIKVITHYPFLLPKNSND